MLTLLLLCWCCFPGKALQYHTGVQTPEWKPRLVWSCLGLYIVFLTALEFKQELWGLVIVAAGFALLARRVVGPSAQGLLVSAFHRFLYLLQQVQVNKRTFLERTWHGLSSKIICYGDVR